MNLVKAFWNSPVGPKTTHFWGPVLNSLFVVQGLVEWNRPPEKISRNMQMVLSFYSALFMRFALRVRPANYFLFCVHVTNFSLQSNLLIKRLAYERKLKQTQLPLLPSQPESPAPAAK
jgi:hypothetical protein